jgi:hypothetical protein
MIVMYAMFEKGLSLVEAHDLIIKQRDPGDPVAGIWNNLVRIEQERRAEQSTLTK